MCMYVQKNSTKSHEGGTFFIQKYRGHFLIHDTWHMTHDTWYLTGDTYNAGRHLADTSFRDSVDADNLITLSRRKSRQNNTGALRLALTSNKQNKIQTIKSQSDWYFRPNGIRIRKSLVASHTQYVFSGTHAALRAARSSVCHQSSVRIP
jgi:hypothetical protein